MKNMVFLLSTHFEWVNGNSDEFLWNKNFTGPVSSIEATTTKAFLLIEDEWAYLILFRKFVYVAKLVNYLVRDFRVQNA